MRDAREYVNPGDLVAITSSYSLQLKPVVCKQWTYTSFQFFRVYEADRRLQIYGQYQDISEYMDDRFYAAGYTGYIHGTQIEKRVTTISESALNDEEQKYYNALKDELNL